MVTERPTKAAFAVGLPWLCYGVLMTGLSLLESNVPVPARFYRILNETINLPDFIFNLIAFFGIIAAALWSMRPLRMASTRANRSAIVAGIVAASMIGPIIGIIVVWRFAEDVDGIYWMYNAPIVGILTVGIALIGVGIRALLRSRRRGLDLPRG